MNIIEYKGYQASVTYEADDDLLVGRILNIDGIVSFHGTSIQEMKSAFEEALDDYLAYCKESGREPK
jgi:predicted HicB family RNase H-like nuclease